MDVTRLGALKIYNYVYQYKDHLGNIRMNYTAGGRVFSDDNDNVGASQVVIKDESAYYPFGLKHTNYGVTSLEYQSIDGNVVLYPPLSTTDKLTNNYKYQGQERQDELGLNWDSFKWRNYDYALGRFMNIDPLAEDYAYQSPYAFAENKVISHRELEGLEGVWFGALLETTNTPPLTGTAMNVAKTAIETGARTTEAVIKTGEVGNKTEIHHVIPRQLKNNEVVRAAREEGFKFEGQENKIPVPKFSKSSGTGRHGSHPRYNNAIKEKLEAGPGEAMKPIEFVRNIVSETVEAIKTNPDVKINDVLKTNTVIESTGVPRPELPKPVQPKPKETEQKNDYMNYSRA